MEAAPLGERGANVTPFSGYRSPLQRDTVTQRGDGRTEAWGSTVIDRGLAGEAVRYGISGAALAVLYSAVYWTLAAPMGIPVLLANTAAFAVNLVAGWALHSRWSFANRSASGPARTAYSRYFAVNAASYALNSIWVWTIVERLHGSVALSIIPVVTITPAFTFALNRAWIFRSRL